jgi:hypothetical protein
VNGRQRILKEVRRRQARFPSDPKSVPSALVADHFITHGMLLAIAILNGEYEEEKWT